MAAKKTPKKEKPGDLEAQLVVVGGGGAGMAAAVAAAEKGVKPIILLEKRAATGGNTAMSWGLFATGSPAQKRAAIEDQRDELFKTAMTWAHWKSNPRIVRAFIDKSGDTIRWLEEKGLHFDCVAFYPGQSPLVWHMTEGRGAKMTGVLAGECKELGVQVFKRTAAKQLLTGRNGAVTGVRVESEGHKFKIKTKSAIIATGGYGGNKALLKKYSPEYKDNMKCDGLPHKGDGLIMAIEVGAATEGLGLMLMSGPQIPGKVAMKIGKFPETIRVPLMAIALEPTTLWVNSRGQRFADEGTTYHHFMSSNAINRQPGNICYVILDQKLVDTMTNHGITIGMSLSRLRTGMPGLEKELRTKAEEGWVKISDKVSDLAGWIGSNPKVLQSTLDEYNACCDQGYDPLFAKNRRHLLPLRIPPYYAIRANSDLLDTIGGVRVNEHMEVLDEKDRPIPGLYAAGVVAGGWEADTYCDILSGAASSFAVNSGRIAAERAAELHSIGR